MNRRTVYVETTILSYLTARKSTDAILSAHQKVTRDWWATARDSYELYVSSLVIAEAGRGDEKAATHRLASMADLPILEITEESRVLMHDLLDAHALPQSASPDALHVAIAAVGGLDLIVTWNCRHIANGNLVPRIYETLRSRGYVPPAICTVDQLLGGRNVQE